MYGQNQQRPIIDSDGHVLEVQEIFYTIQGEGPLAGSPATFVRLAGCNLACTFCDTDFESAYSRPSKARMSVDEVLEQVFTRRHGSCSLVVLTGGEPMRQNVLPLIDGLLRHGLDVQIETAGTVAPPEHQWQWWGDVCRLGRVVMVVSPKTPKVRDFFYDLPGVHWKYVVRDGWIGEDGLPFGSTQREPGAGSVPLAKPPTDAVGRHLRVWLSPCDDYNTNLNAANMQAAAQACMKHGYRLSLQLHKLLNLP